jgi:hypothetical protein
VTVPARDIHSDKKRNLSECGGLHRSPAGVSTRDGETDAERAERLRREHASIDAETGEHYRPLFDPDGAPDAEPWFVTFERELNRTIAEGGFDTPF